MPPYWLSPNMGLGALDRTPRLRSPWGRHRHRDKTLILVMYRHGLRVSEAIDLRWDQVNFKPREIHINRLKNGKSSTHPMEGDEIRALQRLRRDYPDGPFIFMTKREGPLTRSTVNKLVTRAGNEARFDCPAHPHMLRHACGYYLVMNTFPLIHRQPRRLVLTGGVNSSKGGGSHMSRAAQNTAHFCKVLTLQTSPDFKQIRS